MIRFKYILKFFLIFEGSKNVYNLNKCLNKSLNSTEIFKDQKNKIFVFNLNFKSLFKL